MTVINFTSNPITLYSDLDNPDEFYKLSKRKQEALLDWIHTELKKHEIKSYNLLNSSYSLKHIFQRDYGFYVTNGEFKGAALESGLKPKDYTWKNWTFKLSKKINCK